MASAVINFSVDGRFFGKQAFPFVLRYGGHDCLHCFYIYSDLIRFSSHFLLTREDSVLGKTYQQT